LHLLIRLKIQVAGQGAGTTGPTAHDKNDQSRLHKGLQTSSRTAVTINFDDVSAPNRFILLCYAPFSPALTLRPTSTPTATPTTTPTPMWTLEPDVKWDQLWPIDSWSGRSCVDSDLPAYFQTADDFLCQETGWLTAVEFNGSSVNGTTTVSSFRVIFYSDIPADPGVDASHPGTIYWICIQCIFPANSLIDGFYWHFKECHESTWNDDAAYNASSIPLLSNWGSPSGYSDPDLYGSDIPVGWTSLDASFRLHGVPPVSTPTPTPDCINSGDVNNDGTITAGDAQVAFQIALAMFSPTPEQECRADCDGSGTVTAGDAQIIFRVALGMGDSCSDPN
jgi:hypothetical protein